MLGTDDLSHTDIYLSLTTYSKKTFVKLTWDRNTFTLSKLCDVVLMTCNSLRVKDPSVNYQNIKWCHVTNVLVQHVLCHLTDSLLVFSWLSSLCSPPLTHFTQPTHSLLITSLHTHTLSHTQIHPPRHSAAPSSTAGRLRLSVSASPKTYPERQYSDSISSRTAARELRCHPPPTEPTHWSVTTPGGSLAHSANAERKWSDSFVALHLSFFCLKITCRVQIQPVESICILFFVIFPSS